MALNWQWSDKMGEVIYDNGHKANIYKGNAHMIVLNEFSTNGIEQYSLAWFAADRNHLKNMLGLTKGYDNIIQNWGIKELRLNLKYKETNTIISDFAKAKMEIKIDLYKDKEERD